MSAFPKLPPGVRRLFRLPVSRDQMRDEMEEELRFHLEMRTAALTARGMSGADAEKEAVRRFGNLDEFRASTIRSTVRWTRRDALRAWYNVLAKDVLLGVRRLQRSPLFTSAATLTLAIAIGATASVFGLVEGVLLKAFPYREPGRVYTIWQSNAERHQLQVGMANATFFDFAAQQTAFTGLAIGGFEMQFMVTRSHDAERVTGMPVSGNYLATLGITPALGRPFSADSTGPPEVMLGYDYWQRRFGGERSVLGQTLTLDNPNDASLTPQHTYRIVGVLPPGLPGTAEIVTRLLWDPDNAHNRSGHAFPIIGRLKPGVTPEKGLVDLETIASRLAAAYPKSNAGWSVRMVPLIDQTVGSVRPALAMLFGAAACILLIGAANLANLFLVRCLAREREMALRAALGAIGVYSVLAYIVTQSRREIAVRIALGARSSVVVGEVMRRAVALIGVGIAVGSAAAWMITQLLAEVFLGVSPHDPRAFLGAAMTFVFVALIGAAIPALRTTRVSPVVALQST